MNGAVHFLRRDFKEILSNPSKYGFIFDKEDLYALEATKTIKVDTAITDIADFSKGLGINYKILKKQLS